MSMNEIKERFAQLVMARVVANGWSYKEVQNGIWIYDGLGVAGDHWDGKTFERFFAYTEKSLQKAVDFCNNGD